MGNVFVTNVFFLKFSTVFHNYTRCLGGVEYGVGLTTEWSRVRLLLGRYHVVTTWMDKCLWTGKPSRYKTNTKLDLAFHPSGVGKSNTDLSVWG